MKDPIKYIGANIAYENELALILKDIEHIETQLAKTKKRVQDTMAEVKKHLEE